MMTQSYLLPVSEQDVIDRGQGLLSLLQGNWRIPRVQHFCSGSTCPCGGSRDRAVQSIFDLLSWLLVFSLPATPSFSRSFRVKAMCLQKRQRSFPGFCFWISEPREDTKGAQIPNE